jgi:hypothetical protein
MAIPLRTDYRARASRDAHCDLSVTLTNNMPAHKLLLPSREHGLRVAVDKFMETIGKAPRIHTE